MWLNRFNVPPEADFFLLLGLYPPNPTSLKNTVDVWQPHILLFTHSEMTALMTKIRQRRTDKAEKYFGFGFDNQAEAFLTRGHAEEVHPDYSHCLLSKRQHVIRQALQP